MQQIAEREMTLTFEANTLTEMRLELVKYLQVRKVQDADSFIALPKSLHNRALKISRQQLFDVLIKELSEATIHHRAKP